MMRHRGARARSGPAGSVAFCVVLAGALACRAGPPRDGGARAGEEGELEPVVTAAAYLNAFAFAGTAPDSRYAYVELVNETSETALARRYRGWISADERWMPLLDLRDTLPVPRAAWRVLPGPGLVVRAGDGGRVISLGFVLDAGRVRLDPGRVVAEWTGPTGQRESLALATLEVDGAAQPGLLFFRRAARPTEAPAAAGHDRLLLLSDAAGDGLLVAASGGPGAAVAAGERRGTPGGGAPDSLFSATAWSWRDGTRARWTDVSLRLTTSEAGESWHVEIPQARISGEVRVVSAFDPPGPPAPVSAGDGSRESPLPAGDVAGGPPPEAQAAGPEAQAAGPPASLVWGFLEEGGELRPVGGLSLRIRIP